jgi:hypothetical protein
VGAQGRYPVGPLEGTKAQGSIRLWPRQRGTSKGLPEGSKPRSRGLSVRPAGSPKGATAGETACGSIPGGNVGDTFREGNASEGANPRSAVGMKQGRRGPGGSKPSRG